MRAFDKPIAIQRKDRQARQWVTIQNLHAHVNTTGSNEYTTAGSSRSGHALTFTVRYNPELELVALSMQDHRIAFRGAFYRITSYDDFGLRHQTVKLVSESHGEGDGFRDGR